jgi:hypothetical protein
MPKCPICSKEMKYINNSHLKSHNLTPTQFKAMYPDVEAIPQEIIDSRRQTALASKTDFLAAKLLRDEKRLESYNSSPKLCINCNCIIPYQKRQNKFCGHSCAASLTNKNREIVYTEAAKEKLKILGAKIPRKIGWTKHEKICSVCNSIFIVDWLKKDKKTCSSQCRSKIHALNNYKKDETFGKFGYYKGIYCASSWELAFLVYNLDLGKDIRRCKLTFSYIMNGQEKTYFPDFLMDDVIHEVKGRELDDVVVKTQAVVDAGYQIEVIRKKEITPIIKFLREKYGIKDLTELYDKK